MYLCTFAFENKSGRNVVFCGSRKAYRVDNFKK